MSRSNSRLTVGAVYRDCELIEKNVYLQYGHTEGAGALSLRERVREARVRVSPTKCLVYPHPAFGHPLPEGEGACLIRFTAIANHNTLFDPSRI